jgi:signal transduction histidine kinase
MEGAVNMHTYQKGISGTVTAAGLADAQRLADEDVDLRSGSAGGDPLPTSDPVKRDPGRKETVRALPDRDQRYRHLFQSIPVALLQFDARPLMELLEEARAEGVTDLSSYWDDHPDFLRRALEASSLEEGNDWAVQMLRGPDANELDWSKACFWRESPDTFRRALESRFRGEPAFQEETKIVTLDERIIHVLCTFSYPEPVNELGIAILTLVDITERVRAQKMLQRVQAEFAHAARISMLGQITASIAQEVNQPLAAVTTNGEAGLRWLNRSEPNIAEARQSLKCIIDEGRRASDLIARIRSMAVGALPQQTELSLHDVIGESIIFLRHELHSKGVSVSLHLAPKLPPVIGDRAQLQQVILNLLINAVQAMAQSGAVRRILLIETALSEDETVCCAIEDSGPGINPRYLGRLFDSFFTTKDGGMGIGLAISRSIIEAHGGHIRADNSPVHGGARFSFVLTAAEATSQKAAGCI